MQTFSRWGQTEYNYAVQSTQMAEKWKDFETDGDRYLLQYRTANDEKVRDDHAVLHNTTLPMDDPFWDEYYPPLGWNCRCTVVQVQKEKHPASDSNQAIANGHMATIKTPSFRFNPGKSKQCFPDNVSYIKHSGNNRKERDKAEGKCQTLSLKSNLQSLLEKYIGKETECIIGNEVKEMDFKRITIKHFAEGLFGKKDLFWLKNEIAIRNISDLCKESIYIGKKVSDITHNTNKKTLRLKKATDYFFYYKKVLPNDKTIFLHIGRYRETNKMYLYDATDYNPIKE